MAVFVFLTSVLVILSIKPSSGEKFCSLDDRNINCGLCSTTCTVHDENCYHCPKQCGKLNNCKTVCDPYCRNGICESREAITVCTEGCIPGFSGNRCRDSCSEGCIECDQFNGNCTSCAEGLEGENCNVTRHSSVSTTQSPTTTRTTTSTQSSIVTSTSTQSSIVTSTSTRSSTLTTRTTDGTTPAASQLGNFGALSLTVLIGIALVYYKCRHRFQIKCKKRQPRTSNIETRQGSDGSSPPNTGYVYIDDDNLEASHIRPQPDDALPPRCPNDNYDESVGNRRSPPRFPKNENVGNRSPPRSPNGNYYEPVGNRRSPPRCPPNGNYYESIGNRKSTSTDAGSESSQSTWSGTLFGNLLETNGGIADRELNPDIEIVSLEEYEMNTRNYLTPNLSINSKKGASLV